jgi:hypothetical protein
MYGGSIKLWAVVKENILSVAINRWYWTVGEFRTRLCAPKVEAVIFGVV